MATPKARKGKSPARSRSAKDKPGPNTVLATYRVKAGKEEQFLALIARHWPTLRKLGLVTADKPIVWRGIDEEQKTVFYEVFTWKDFEAPGTSHHLPEVMAIWGPMGELAEERMGRPRFEFPHVEPVRVRFARV
jgi:hypothetical protein